ncbi:MAG: PAS domain-containing sensor histidine kinase [Chloroflexi bacterium]|nr:MAG: PAS domain-containing sensor histidine kinase [Chloroflexota bacterium]
MSSRAYAPRVQQTAILAGPQRRPLTVTGLGIEGWAPFAAAAAAAAAISVLFAGWTAGHWISDSATVSIDDIGEAVAAFVAAASCGFASARTSGRTRVAWGLFALSALSWAVGEVVWSVYEVGMGVEVPFPSLADAGFLVAIPFAVAGVLAFTSAPTRLATRGETVLAGSIVALSLLFVAWAAGLSNVYATSTQSLATQVIALAYPVGDIIIATTLVVALRRARRADVGRMLLLIGGLACNALADSAFAYMTANGTYGVLGSALDTGWVVGYLLIALAPLWPARPTGTEAPEGPIELWQLGLPWVAVLAAAVTVIRMGALGQTLDPFASALAGGIGVLLVANQVLTHRDSLDLLDQSRRMEAQLARRNNLLDQIVSHAPLGIARVGTDMKIIDVNPRMAALLRIEPQKMVGTAVADYLRQDEFERVFEVFQPLWRGAVDTVESDSHAIRADHSEVWLHWSATGVRNASGRIDYFIAMYEDNDAEHAANEAAAAHLAGLERLNRLKSEFVSLVSHEFRTALVGISGFSEMIRDEDVSLDEAKVYAGDINKDAERLNRMINDMLDLDRIEAGRLTLHHQTVDMNNLVEDAVDRARASSARHTFTCNLAVEKPVVQADPDRIAQVLSNLLSNAIKYSPDGGDIAVTSLARDGVVEVSVHDHGVGIAPEFVDRLFSRYERYEKSASKIIGTGLGLAISRQIVEMHGGKIWVESKQGDGSDFRFTIPVGQVQS